MDEKSVTGAGLLDRRFTTLIGGNVKGGIGKTTCLQFVTSMLHSRDGADAWAVTEVDDQRKAGGGWWRDCMALSLTSSADIKKVETDGSAMLEHYDPLARLMVKGNLIVDQGANVQRPFLEWAVMSDLPAILDDQGVGVDLAVVTDHTEDSIEPAAWMLKNYPKVFGTMRSYRLFLVLNDRLGKGFDEDKKSPASMLRAMARDLGAAEVSIPFAKSKLLVKAWQQYRVQPLEALSVIDKLAAAEGLDPMDVFVCRERKNIKDWLKAVQGAVAPILPPAAVLAPVAE